jgi:hypothetical protein
MIKFNRYQWPTTPSMSAADYKYAVEIDGTFVGMIWQDDFSAPWIAERRDGTKAQFKTRKAAGEWIGR